MSQPISQSTTDSPTHLNTIGNNTRNQVAIVLSLLAAMWLLEIVDWLAWGQPLDRFGIYPRSSIGLRNIFLAPFLHVGFSHLMANSLPFTVLGWFVLLRRTQDFWWVTIITIIVGGLGVWLFGAENSIHLGASSLIFGYLGYLLLRGFVERSVPGISLALLVIFLYGGMVWGILPGRPGISWLGHLFGFLGGSLAALLLAER